MLQVGGVDCCCLVVGFCNVGYPGWLPSIESSTWCEQLKFTKISKRLNWIDDAVWSWWQHNTWRKMLWSTKFQTMDTICKEKNRQNRNLFLGKLSGNEKWTYRFTVRTPAQKNETAKCMTKKVKLLHSTSIILQVVLLLCYDANRNLFLRPARQTPWTEIVQVGVMALSYHKWKNR